MTNKEIAIFFSGGNFEQVENNLSENIEWYIYENAIKLEGKKAVVEFSKNVTQYFQSVTTKFDLYGLVEGQTTIAIYGHAEFIKQGETVNKVNSCDVYEFDQYQKIVMVHSYCNSAKP